MSDSDPHLYLSPPSSQRAGDERKMKEKKSDSATLAALERVRERDHKLRRVQGALSCAECRRMRIKCDKKIPCSSCIRRHCSHVCPTGTKLSVGTVNDLDEELESPIQLKKRLLFLMSERVAVLEDALHIHGGDEHPLLESSLVLERARHLASIHHCASEPVVSPDDILEELGSTIVVKGDQIKYIGAENTEYELVRNVMQGTLLAHPRLLSKRLPLSSDLLQACDMFPFLPPYLRHPSSYSQLLRYLPTYARVTSLVETYITNLSWFLTPVDSAQIREEIIPTFYPGLKPMLATSSDWNVSLLPSLALLYAVLACGSAGDWTQDLINDEAETFDRLTRCTLGLSDVFGDGGGDTCGGGTVEAAQAMLCLSLYEMLTLRRFDREADWRLLAYSLSVIMSLGLHRDPSRWGLDEKQSDRYRRVFWQANSMDKLRSMASGRPTLFDPAFIDCKLPKDTDVTIEIDGTEIESVWHWRMRFSRDVLTPFTELMTSTKPVAYSRVLVLDKEWCDFRSHPYCLRSPNEGINKDATHMQTHHPLVTMWWKHITLQRLHRNFFARALAENPRNPTQSRFSRSFLQMFDSSKVLLELGIAGYETMTRFFVRVHSMWANALVSSVVMSAIACRVTEGAYAAQALDYLSRMLNIFEGAKDQHPIALHGREFLSNLRQRGFDAQTRFASTMSKSLSVATPPASSSDDTEEIEEIPITVESLLASNDPSFGDADLRVLRNTSAQIVEPVALTGVSDFNQNKSSSPSGNTSPFSRTPPPPPASPPSFFESTIVFDEGGFLSMESSQTTEKEQTSSPWSSDSSGSWSTIASEFGLDEQDLGMWRGIDSKWDSTARCL